VVSTDDRPVEVTVVTMAFEAESAAAAGLFDALARYTVLTRMAPGCRNVDLCGSVSRPGRLVLIEKWADPDRQRAHFDGPLTQELAQACRGLVRAAPEIELLEGLSAHDVR
jgi:quinol monooxygenase YgiN